MNETIYTMSQQDILAILYIACAGVALAFIVVFVVEVVMARRRGR